MYLPDGTFDRERTSAQVTGMLARARAEGFPRARLIGRGPGIDDPSLAAAFVEYEARMTDVLAQYDDPKTASLLLSEYPQLPPREKRAALATLASRAGYAMELLRSVERKEVAGADLTANTAAWRSLAKTSTRFLSMNTRSERSSPGASANGGSVVMPLEKTYWAEAFGMVTDKFGIKWMVNCDAPR